MSDNSNVLTKSVFTTRELDGYSKVFVCAVKPESGKIAEVTIYFVNPKYPDRVNGALECSAALGYEAEKVNVNGTSLPDNTKAEANSDEVHRSALKNDYGHLADVYALQAVFAGKPKDLLELGGVEMALNERLDALETPGSSQQVLPIKVPEQRTSGGQAAIVAEMCGKLCATHNRWFEDAQPLVKDDQYAKDDIGFASRVLEEFFASLYAVPVLVERCGGERDQTMKGK